MRIGHQKGQVKVSRKTRGTIASAGASARLPGDLIERRETCGCRQLGSLAAHSPHNRLIQHVRIDDVLGHSPVQSVGHLTRDPRPQVFERFERRERTVRRDDHARIVERR